MYVASMPNWKLPARRVVQGIPEPEVVAARLQLAEVQRRLLGYS